MSSLFCRCGHNLNIHSADSSKCYMQDCKCDNFVPTEPKIIYTICEGCSHHLGSVEYHPNSVGVKYLPVQTPVPQVTQVGGFQ